MGTADSVTPSLDVSRDANLVCETKSLGRVERGKKRATPLPPRADLKRRRRGAGHGLGQAISACRVGQFHDHAADGPQQAAIGPEDADGEWIKPWERRPDWEYLPHLGEGGGDAVPAGETDRLDELDARRPRHAEEPPGDRRRSGIGTMSAGGTMDTIRGRVSPLGAQDCGVLGGRARVVKVAEIRGHSQMPGPTIDLERSRAQERLNAKNSHLAQSLADHEERVTRRSMVGDRPKGASATERLEALRRRVNARIGAGEVFNVQAPVEEAHRGAAVVDAGGGGQRLGDKDDARVHGGNGVQARSCSLVGAPTGQGDEVPTKCHVAVRMAEASSDMHVESPLGTIDAGNRCMDAQRVHRAGGRNSNEEYKMHLGEAVEEHLHHSHLHGGRIHDAAACMVRSSSSACGSGSAPGNHTAEGESRQTVREEYERRGSVAPPSSAVVAAASVAAWHSNAPSV